MSEEIKKDQSLEIKSEAVPSVDDPSSKFGTTEHSAFGTLKHTDIVDEMEKSYLDYAMSVIVSRALQDVRDGLQPVHRRILYSMYKSGIHHNTV